MPVTAAGRYSNYAVVILGMIWRLGRDPSHLQELLLHIPIPRSEIDADRHLPSQAEFLKVAPAEPRDTYNRTYS